MAEHVIAAAGAVRQRQAGIVADRRARRTIECSSVAGVGGGHTRCSSRARAACAVRADLVHSARGAIRSIARLDANRSATFARELTDSTRRGGDGAACSFDTRRAHPCRAANLVGAARSASRSIHPCVNAHWRRSRAIKRPEMARVCGGCARFALCTRLTGALLTDHSASARRTIRLVAHFTAERSTGGEAYHCTNFARLARYIARHAGSARLANAVDTEASIADRSVGLIAHRVATTHRRRIAADQLTLVAWTGW
jgi:hypothetical protein